MAAALTSALELAARGGPEAPGLRQAALVALIALPAAALAQVLADLQTEYAWALWSSGSLDRALQATTASTRAMREWPWQSHVVAITHAAPYALVCAARMLRLSLGRQVASALLGAALLAG